MAGKDQDNDDGGAFSRLLSRNKADLDEAGNGKALHPSGRKLPENERRVDEQQHVADESPDTVDIDDAGISEITPAESLPAMTVDLPAQPVNATVPQEPVPGITVSEGTGDMVVQGVSKRTLDADEPAVVTATDELVQDKGADIQQIAATVPGQQAASVETLQEDMDRDNGGLPGVPASFRTTAESGRASSDPVSAGNAVREAVHLAVASQASDGNLKQSLQQNGYLQFTHGTPSAPDSTSSQAIPFMQELSNSTVTIPVARVQVPVGQPGWGEAVGQQVTWFVSRDISAASLKLNPQHLGPMEMSVSMDGDKASISFTSHHAIVRESLESSIPRLREMLSENGLDLVNVNVSQQGKSYDGRGASSFRQGSAAADADNGPGESVSGPGIRQMTMHTQGLVDYYA